MRRGHHAEMSSPRRAIASSPLELTSDGVGWAGVKSVSNPAASSASTPVQPRVPRTRCVAPAVGTASPSARECWCSRRREGGGWPSAASLRARGPRRVATMPCPTPATRRLHQGEGRQARARAPCDSRERRWPGPTSSQPTSAIGGGGGRQESRPCLLGVEPRGGRRQRRARSILSTFSPCCLPASASKAPTSASATWR